MSMSTDELASLRTCDSLDALKRKRRYVRKQIKTAQQNVEDYLAGPLTGIQESHLEVMGEEAKAELVVFNAIQNRIEELVLDEDALDAEEEERQEVVTLHRGVQAGIKKAIDMKAVSVKAGALVVKLDRLNEYKTFHDCSGFEKDFAEYQALVEKLEQVAAKYKGEAEVERAVQPLSASLSVLINKREKEAEEKKKDKTDVSPKPAAKATTPYLAPLQIEMPTFNGDPLRWSSFQSMFTNAISKRAADYSEMDKRFLLLKALEHPEAKSIASSITDEHTTLDEVLEKLRKVYGRPQKIASLLTNDFMEYRTYGRNYEDLRALQRKCVDGMANIKSVTKDSLSTFGMLLYRQRFQKDLLEEWERYTSGKEDLPTVEELGKFLEERLLSMEPSAQSTKSKEKTTTPPVYKCLLCEDKHYLAKCSVFQGYDVDRRNRMVRDRHLCLNCLTTGHTNRSCPSKFTCKTCGGKHHSLLHREKIKTEAAAAPVRVINTQGSDNEEEGVAVPYSLYTVLVKVHNGNNTAIARAALDSGGSVSLISESLASSLKLKRKAYPLMLDGHFTGARSKQCTTANLTSLNGGDSYPVTFSVVTKLKPLPKPHNYKEVLALPGIDALQVIDKDMGGPVDIYIGIQHLETFRLEGKVFSTHGVRAINTVFGWCVSGPLSPEVSAPSLAIQAAEDTLATEVRKLWQLDEVLDPRHPQDDDQTVNEFKATHEIMQDGRYAVQLPRVPDPPELGDSKGQAVVRFLANEKSLSRKGKLEDFNAAMTEYITLDHAEKVPKEEVNDRPSYYLPVHGVFKETSTSTKLRPVFDASAKSKSGVSLNDTLLAGPNLYPHLTDVLINFRMHKIAFSADITKMFREILLLPKERNLHRFIMRDETGRLADYRMKRLTFGVKSSPYLATQVLRDIADKHSLSHPEAAEAIAHDFYVDDLLSGADTLKQAKEVREQLCEVLNLHQMKLCKWKTNDKQLRDSIPEELKGPEELVIATDNADVPKALGIHWDTNSDVLHVSTPVQVKQEGHVTKRDVASVTAQVFDVLGLFSPSVIIARILLQDLWRFPIGWDDAIPDILLPIWKSWTNSLPAIMDYSIPRKMVTHDSPSMFQSLHVFADASNKAYGAVIYLRNVHEDNSITTALVTAKARVLPIKPITTPKAELVAAVLAAKLVINAAKVLKFSMEQVYAWTDSEIVLHWLTKERNKLEVFVRNRVSAILELLPASHWRHVPSAQNPADICSRGMSAETLVKEQLWWKGPPWLSESQQYWPHSKALKKARPPEIEAPCKAIVSGADKNLPFIEQVAAKFSSFHRLCRVIAWVLRFYGRCRKTTNNCLNFVDTSEVTIAKNMIFALAQDGFWLDVKEAVTKNKQLPKHHKFNKLSFQLLQGCLLCLQSRVRDSTSPTAPALRIMLPHKSAVTKLMLKSLHIDLSHAGISAMMSVACHSYYIIGLRSILKHISKLCMHCQRAYAVPLTQRMGLLPEVRTTPAPPFFRTGIDFAGPFYIKLGRTRKPVLVKVYACVFVCMSTKAVHLDLCKDLSTQEFMATLTRFICRRGVPSNIWSDNGTNFLGAHSEIKELQSFFDSSHTRMEISNFAGNKGIAWHHTPPRAPHFGGLWEAAVKSMKTLLRKNTAGRTFTWDELYTLLALVEASLNSRPLTPLHSASEEDVQILTAGHFLIGRPLGAPPMKLRLQAEVSNLKRWNMMNRIANDLWRQWTAAYLQICASRVKWNRAARNLKVDDIVFVKDETLKYKDWPIARITRLYPGSDGVTRAVDIRCQGKEYTRPVAMLIPFLQDEGNKEKQSKQKDLPPHPPTITTTTTPAPEDVWDSSQTKGGAQAEAGPQLCTAAVNS